MPVGCNALGWLFLRRTQLRRGAVALTFGDKPVPHF